MGIEVVMKLAGIGFLTAVACQLLKQAGREDIAMMTALAGLVIVLVTVVSMVGQLMQSVRGVFGL
ncbi:MAG: stage III sporulation protein AC [Clostridia bacterium]|nr:stage III sporulation protein AC [Clostridia bacterium]MBQ2517933.1 stage III sporulation protein AC [Clostridia bacterium]MBQ4340911.1 stage III sporulation protein AC [Clostridia bacterium]MBR6428965.1 stage III sporulation protein AC [Clostridia bacterium]